MCLLTGSFCSGPQQQEAELGAEARGQQQGGGGGGVRHSFVLPSGVVFLVSCLTLVHHQNPDCDDVHMRESVHVINMSLMVSLALTRRLELCFH